MALKQTIDHMKHLLTQVLNDLDKAEGGNKAASQRVRTGTIKLEKTAKVYRKESIHHEKSSPGRKKSSAKKAKPAEKKASHKAHAAKKTVAPKKQAPAKKHVVAKKTTNKSHAMTVKKRSPTAKLPTKRKVAR